MGCRPCRGQRGGVTGGMDSGVTEEGVITSLEDIAACIIKGA